MGLTGTSKHNQKRQQFQKETYSNNLWLYQIRVVPILDEKGAPYWKTEAMVVRKGTTEHPLLLLNLRKLLEKKLED